MNVVFAVLKFAMDLSIQLGQRLLGEYPERGRHDEEPGEQGSA